jgi:CheY-like chemotaxis protein
MDIIGESLDLARIEAGKLVLTPRAFDLRLLMAEVMEIKRAKAAAKGLRIRCVITRDLPEMILGDAGRFRQIVTNLVGNAIKFTKRGSVTVGLRRARPTSDISVPRIELVVADTGVGIPEDLAEAVFQPFQQIQTIPGNLSEGIGLGLAIARELVSLMQGGLGVACRRHGGSRFVVTLPLQPATAAPAPIPVRIPPPRRFKGSVLLVEDDPISCEVATLMLQRCGLTVDTAADGEEGLRRLLSGHYDLAFVDCWMPLLDGPGMTRRDMPVIALTANTQPADIEASRVAGMNHYLTKPLMDEALFDCLNRFAPPASEPADCPPP